MPNRKNKLSTFTIPEELLEKLQRRSDKTGIPKSVIISGLINTLEDWEESNENRGQSESKLMAAIINYDWNQLARAAATTGNRHYDNKIRSFVQPAERTRTGQRLEPQEEDTTEAEEEQVRALLRELYGGSGNEKQG